MGKLATALQRPVRDYRVLMLGLDAAGKTTILHKLKLGEVVATIPTIGMNVESVQMKKLQMTSFDVGGRGRIRPLWRHYFQNTDALCIVVDSNDRERIEEIAGEMRYLFKAAELEGIPLMVLCNKQDLPNAMSVAEVTEKLALRTIKSRQWNVVATCAVTGDGLYEAFDWLAHTVNENIQPTQSGGDSSAKAVTERE